VKRVRPSIRRRLTVIASVAVTLVAVAVGVLAWLALRQTLTQQADRELQAMAHGPISGLTADAAAHVPSTPLDAQQDMRTQIRFPDGTTVTMPRNTAALPRTAADQAVADHTRDRAAYTLSTDSGRYRILTYRGDRGQTVQLARSLAGTDSTLRSFGALIVAMIAGATTVAALAGRLVARAGLRPVEQLTSAATRIADTRDLSEPIPVSGHDEIAQLGQAFNHMLTRIGAAQAQQRELIEDAAHELRTPMSSMRTNVELLIHAGSRLGDADRTALLSDLDRQSVELADLVANLVDLARAKIVDEPRALVDLAELAAEATGLAEAHFPLTSFVLTAEQPLTAYGRPQALLRALVNLLDNAAKFGPANHTVELHLTRGPGYAQIEIRDRCLTIPADHRERIFQRFARLDDARAVPGSGLGLAIVHQTVSDHQGSIAVSPRPGGGNNFRLRIPFGDQKP